MSFQPGELVTIEVTDVAQGGWCVARPPGAPAVFVRHALPGEVVLARVTEVTSRFARADAVEIAVASTDRVDPPCPAARPGGCGGCDWQHAALPAQRALKAAVIGGHLRRLARLDRRVTVEPLPAAGPGEDPAGSTGAGPGLGWRTRVQFAVSGTGLAGLRAHRSHEVVDVGDCLIAHPGIRDLGIPRRSWPGATSVEAAVGSGARAVIVTTGGPAPEEDWAATVAGESVLTRTRRRLNPVRGRPYLTQRAAERDWRVSAGVFWQVHPAAADTLATAVLAALEPGPGDTALDLYCGAGLFAGVIAPLVGSGGSVVGVESDEAAVRDARHNLRDFRWVRVHRGDVARMLSRGRPGRGEPRRDELAAARLAVADPPRAGLAREVIEHLSAGSAGRFAYVSCDPVTLARDLGLLLARGWTLTDLRAFDAFPMTHHVECVATLTR